jgi:hypothetical protein
MERKRYVESVQKVMIGGREITVTQTRPVFTPEELLAARIKIKKMLNNALEQQKNSKAT